MPKKADAPTDIGSKAIESWAHEDIVAWYLLSQCLPNTITLPLSTYPTAKARWDQLVEEHCQECVCTE